MSWTNTKILQHSDVSKATSTILHPKTGNDKLEQTVSPLTPVNSLRFNRGGWASAKIEILTFTLPQQYSVMILKLLSSLQVCFHVMSACSIHANVWNKINRTYCKCNNFLNDNIISTRHRNFILASYFNALWRKNMAVQQPGLVL